MYRLWGAVGTYHAPSRIQCAWVSGGGGDAGEYQVRDGMLRLILERGHPALAWDDDDEDVIDAQVLIAKTLNGDHSAWPESHGMTEEEWAEMYAEGDAIRAARAAAAVEGEAA